MSTKQPLGAYKKLNIEQISQRVYEDSCDALRIKSVDPITATIDGDVSFSGEVTVTPPSDRRFRKFTLTASAQALVFAGFEIKGISIKADQLNDGRVKIGESTLVTSDDFTILEPGEVYSAEINGTLNPIYAVFDTGTTSAVLYVTALGDPI